MLYNNKKLKTQYIITHFNYNNIIKIMSQFKLLTGSEQVLKTLAGCVTGPLGFFTVKSNHVKVITRFGKVDRVCSQGLRWAPLTGEAHEIFCGTNTFKLSKMNITDKHATPILASSIINFKVADPEKWLIVANENNHIVENNVETVIRNVLKKFPYTSESEPDIKSNSSTLCDELTRESNSKLESFGVLVESVQMVESVYSPEIAQSMLMKQQAQATVFAKKEIVNGAVGIIKDVLKEFPDLNKRTQEKIAVNLLTTIASHGSASNVIKLE
jgi:regulator of protease activity HflC (stomatin/prohibitin superfamily)